MRLRNNSPAAGFSLFESKAGFTLVEVMVASTLVALFFASLFELNAMCLRSIDSGKESLVLCKVFRTATRCYATSRSLI